jgi:hypothetical protein
MEVTTDPSATPGHIMPAATLEEIMDENQSAHQAVELISQKMRSWFESFQEGDLPTPEQVREHYLQVYEAVQKELGLRTKQSNK